MRARRELLFMPPHPGSRVIKTQFLLLLFVRGEFHCTQRRKAVKSLLYLHRDLNSRSTITDSGHELINNEISFICMRFTIFLNLIYRTTSVSFILKIALSLLRKGWKIGCYLKYFKPLPFRNVLSVQLHLWAQSSYLLYQHVYEISVL